MKRYFRWFLLFTKRLYHRPTFWIFILMIPLVIGSVAMVEKTDRSMVVICLAQEDPSDPVSTAITERLMHCSDRIRFVMTDPGTAMEQVTYGKADAAWIFSKNLLYKLEKYVESPSDRHSIISVYQQRDTVMLKLARERLHAAVFRECATTVYLHSLRDTLPETEEIPDDILLEYWQKTEVSGQLFSFTDGQGQIQDSPSYSLQYSLKGILLVVSAMFAVACGAQFHKDEEAGLYMSFSVRDRYGLELIFQIASLLQFHIAGYLTLSFLGLHRPQGLDFLTLLLSSGCCSGFGMLIRSVFGGGRRIMAAMPILCVGMLLLCPVFTDYGSASVAAWLFPPTYTLSLNVWQQIGYTVVCILLAVTVQSFKDKISLIGRKN